MSTVAIPTPLFPAIEIARDVASEEARVFIKFVPIRTTVKSSSIFERKSAAFLEPLRFSAVSLRIFSFDVERYAVSEPEKNATARIMAARASTVAAVLR